MDLKTCSSENGGRPHMMDVGLKAFLLHYFPSKQQRIKKNIELRSKPSPPFLAVAPGGAADLFQDHWFVVRIAGI